jgi:hypothetical protein
LKGLYLHYRYYLIIALDVINILAIMAHYIDNKKRAFSEKTITEGSAHSIPGKVLNAT